MRRKLLAGGVGFLIFFALGLGFTWAYEEFGLTRGLALAHVVWVVLIPLFVGGRVYEVICEGLPTHNIFQTVARYFKGEVICNIGGWLPAYNIRHNDQSIIAGLIFYGIVDQIWGELFYIYINRDSFGIVIILDIATAVLAVYLTRYLRDRRLFARKGVRIVLGLLDDVNEGFYRFDSHALKLIRDRIEHHAFADSVAIVKSVRGGTPPRQLLYRMIVNISGDHIRSGQHNLYRGVLNDMGNALYKIYNSSVDELGKMGAIDEKEAKETKEYLAKQIKQAG